MGSRGGSSHRATAGGGTLASLQSNTAIEQWLRNQGYFPAGALISLRGVDLTAARSIADAYKRVFDRYPQLKGMFAGLSAKSLGANTYAQNWLMSGKLEVNTKFFKDSANLASSYKRDVASNWHPTGTDWESIVTHEIGHAIDGYLTKHFGGWGGDYYSTSFQQRVFAELGIAVTKDNVSREVSRYGATQAAEWFAEAFAEGTRSATPRTMAKKFMEDLDDIMQTIRRHH